MTDLLVVAGEASGDRAAAQVMSALGGVRAFGMGGPALAAAGLEVVADLRTLTALGVGEVVARAAPIAFAHVRIAAAARRRKPRAALLVNYSEFNSHLAKGLHAAGVRVLWYVAPQVWAWRPGRIQTLRRSVDRMAVILPFEEELWRRNGVDAHYVGHPARETTTMDRDTARRALGLTPYASAIAIMPGSRPHEVTALLPAMLDAYELVRRERASVDARILLAPSLDARTRSWALELGASRNVGIFLVDAYAGAISVLEAFDAALTASGTAALEAALARAVPIVVYRTGLLTEIAARALLGRTPRIALPNILLGRTVFPELLQRDVHPRRLAEALGNAFDARSEFLKACDEVEATLGPRRFPSREVARMIEPWLTKQSA